MTAKGSAHVLSFTKIMVMAKWMQVDIFVNQVKYALFSSKTELGSNLSLTVDGHSCNLDGGAYWILVVPSSKSQMIRLDFENVEDF